ncbi:MAG TPA: BamA/TamA family outer membrane protein [Elusimicrobiota bacterium]|nr:BamA/TamA family outer membrane protein [Elusimicrobiota bacterium]
MLLLLASFAAASDGPCPNVRFRGPAVRLTDVERKLLCGDPGLEGWRTVPLNQAEYFMRAFLQQRGYQDPAFSVSSGTLTVEIGSKTRVTSLRVRGFPDGVDASKLRRLKGGELTPKELDGIRSALIARLQSSGFPCPDVQLSADGVTGAVDAVASPGAPGTMGPIVPAELEKVDPRVFRRYEAFRPEQSFDMRLLNLTAQRTIADSLFVSAYYDVSCSTSGATIVQHVVEGKPRLYKLGVGFDSEGYLIGKAQWKKSRIGWRNSTLEGALYASFREETLDASMHYYVDPASRLYLMPQATFDREDQVNYQYVTEQAAVEPGTSWETESLRAEVQAGPVEEHVTTVRGVGPPNDTFLSLRTRWTLTDHLFEYYAADPRQGWRTTIETRSRAAGAQSDLTAHRVESQGQALWNLGGDDPPVAVFGSRYWAGTTLVNDPDLAQRLLAPDMRFFLGGDSNIRGISLNGLPTDQAGFLTVAYDGVELRMGDVLPYGLQPFIFLDGAMAGRKDAHLDPDVYWSPGFGLRWRLPVGSIRGTVARGLIWRRDETAPALYPDHWQLFLSFGQEF